AGFAGRRRRPAGVRVNSFSPAAVGFLLMAAVCSVFTPRRASPWEVTVDAGAFGIGFGTVGLGVAATTDNDAVVVGSNDFVVVKLARTTGQELWHYTAGPAGHTSPVAADAGGGVVPAGALRDPRATAPPVRLSRPAPTGR